MLAPRHVESSRFYFIQIRLHANTDDAFLPFLYDYFCTSFEIECRENQDLCMGKKKEIYIIACGEMLIAIKFIYSIEYISEDICGNDSAVLNYMEIIYICNTYVLLKFR